MQDQLTKTYAYDVAGNMTDKHLYNTQTGGSSLKDLKYIYDAKNCLTEVQLNNETVARYEYDTAKQMIYSWTKFNNEIKEKIYHWNSSGQIIGEGVVLY